MHENSGIEEAGKSIFLGGGLFESPASPPRQEVKQAFATRITSMYCEDFPGAGKDSTIDEVLILSVCHYQNRKYFFCERRWRLCGAGG